MFSQFVKQSSRFLSADMPPARAQILHNPVVTRMKLNILKEGGGGGGICRPKVGFGFVRSFR